LLIPPLALQILCLPVLERLNHQMPGAGFASRAAIWEAAGGALVFALVLLWTDPQSSHPFVRLLMLPFFAVPAWVVIRMWLRGTGRAGVTVPDGELRERVIVLGRQASVKVRGLYVTPEGPTRNLPALAMGNRSVMLAARLIRELSRDEVEAVAARQIA